MVPARDEAATSNRKITSTVTYNIKKRPNWGAWDICKLSNFRMDIGSLMRGSTLLTQKKSHRIIKPVSGHAWSSGHFE